MTERQSDTLFPVDPLPGDKRSSLGKRTKDSPWATYYRKDLEVTQDDIDGAMRQNSHSCMIADAIKRQVKGAKNVSVDLATIRWTDTIKNRRIVCLTPPACQDGLCRFDLGINPKPFRFNLRSTQITTVHSEKRLDAEGKPVRASKRAHVRKDGTVSEHENGFAPGRHKPPTPRVEAATARSADPVVLGGRTPPRHHASLHRKFGVRGFTWLDGEDPASVIERQKLGQHEAIDVSEGG